MENKELRWEELVSLCWGLTEENERLKSLTSLELAIAAKRNRLNQSPNKHKG